MRRQSYVTIITGIRYSDNTAHTTLPSFSMITFVCHISRVRVLLHYCTSVIKVIVLLFHFELKTKLVDISKYGRLKRYNFKQFII